MLLVEPGQRQRIASRGVTRGNEAAGSDALASEDMKIVAGSGNSDADFSGNSGALISGNSGRVEQTSSGLNSDGGQHDHSIKIGALNIGLQPAAPAAIMRRSG